MLTGPTSGVKHQKPAPQARRANACPASLRRLGAKLVWRRSPKGRVLAIKWGLNPNSSSLGVDVTFLLFGAAALSLATPFVSALVRLKLAKEPELVEQDEKPSS